MSEPEDAVKDALGEAPGGQVGRLGVYTQGCSVGDQGFQKDVGAMAG